MHGEVRFAPQKEFVIVRALILAGCEADETVKVELGGEKM